MSKHKSDLETQSAKLLLRIQPSEKQGFTEAARIAGISLTAWIRERLRLAAIRDLENAGKNIPFIKDL